MHNFSAIILAFFFLLIIFLPKSVLALAPVPILTYHFIANNPNSKDTQRDALSVSPDKFDSQMSYLSQNGYTPITLDTYYGILNNITPSLIKPIILTFDDGYIDFYTNAFPILRKYNFHAVSFIPTGLIGGSYYMNWEQIKEITASGLVTFESHSISHPNLTALSYTQILKELQESKKILNANTNYPVNFVSYPYGTSNLTVLQAAKQAGYVGGVGTWFGKAIGGGMNMPRIKVSGYWSIKEFASRL